MVNQITSWNVAHKLEKKGLLIAINALAGLAIFFFGYDQGMMGGVNVARNYVDTMGFGYVDENDNVTVTNSLLQGGIVSVYYLGTLVGGLFGGWVAERTGRIKGMALGAAVAIVGAALQCSAQNATWMICGMYFCLRTIFL